MFLTLFSVLSIVTIGYLIKSTIKPRKFPPGPKWLPLIGCSNIVQRMTQKHGSQFKGLLELAKDYSTQVLGLKLGGELIVVAYGERNVRQTFTEKAFEGRPNSFFLRLRCLGKKLGITFTDGPLWRENRQFTVKQLKNVGFGKTPMEKEIQHELCNILGYIEANRHKSIDPDQLFSAAVMNILWKYVAGETPIYTGWNFLTPLVGEIYKLINLDATSKSREMLYLHNVLEVLKQPNKPIVLSVVTPRSARVACLNCVVAPRSALRGSNLYIPFKVPTKCQEFIKKYRHLGGLSRERINEEKLKFVLDLFGERSKAFSVAGGLLNQAPWCRFIIPELSGYNLIVKLNKQLSDIIEETINKHKNKEVEGFDFIYSYLEEINQKKEMYTEEQLKLICLDLLIAGSQTTGNSLKFAILKVLRESKMQEFIYEEIKTHIGDNVPCWADNTKLVYTSAFLLETLRYYPIAPVAGPRRVLEDTVMDGYIIPKDTTVLISVRDIHFDPELWDDPHEFRPERFINENGTLKNSEHMYHFGLGRRRCPGDSLARSFLFITFVGILQKYLIHCSNGTLPSEEPIIGLILSPKPFSVEFSPRK